MAVAKYTVEALVNDMRAVVADTVDDKRIIQRIIPLAQRIANQPGWIQDTFYECDPDPTLGLACLAP